MTNRITVICGLFLIGISVVLGAYFYPILPENIASHWNTQGMADDTMPKFWGLFLFPIIMAFMLAFAFVLPFFDPLKKNIAAFRPVWNAFWLSIIAFFFYLFILSLVWNTGTTFNFGQAIIPAMAALWFGIGVCVEKSKRNWIFGIRTPWTLSSDDVWEKTHRLGGVLFKISAVITLIGFVFPQQAIFLAVIPVIATALITAIYSWVIFYQAEK